jgi:hypothetical protein
MIDTDTQGGDSAETGDNYTSHPANFFILLMMPGDTRSGIGVRGQEGNRVLNGLNLFCRIVRNFAAELFLESHDQFNGIQAVRAEIVNKTGIIRYLRLVYTEMLDNDFLNPIRNVAHLSLSFSFAWHFPLIPAIPDGRGA